MKAKSERLLLVGSMIGVMAIAGAIGFRIVAEGNRDAAVAKLVKLAPDPKPSVGHAFDRSDRPGSVARYAQLFEHIKDIPSPRRWQNEFGGPPRNWTDEQWKQVEAELAGMQDLLREARQAAELGGRALDLDLSRGMGTELPHLAYLQTLARLLSLDAWALARGSHYESAVQDILAIMRLADCLVDEPFIISQIHRISIYILAYDTLRLALPPAALSPELARVLMEYASRSAHREAFANAFFGEANALLIEFERIRKGAPVAQVLDGGYWFSGDRQGYSRMEEALEDALVPLFQGKTAIAQKIYDTPVGKPWRDMDEATCVSLLTAMAETARLPYHQARPLLEQIQQQIEALPTTRLLTTRFASRLPKSIASQARLEATLDLIQLGLALDQYGKRNGTYPDSINTVASVLGGRIPVDPFTGQPYLYRVSDGGCLLYSVGQNLVDDGGRDNHSDGDIVWRTQQNTTPKSIVSPDEKAKTIAMN